MSEGSANPIVVLFEDRPKQSMVFQLNLSIYLDARVVIASSAKDLSRALTATEGVQLVVTRALIKNTEPLPEILTALGTTKVPVIGMGDLKETPGVTVIQTDTEVKPLLQAAARLLGITAKHMVSKERPMMYNIKPEFLNMLFTVPCDIYDAADDKKLFSSGEAVPREKIARLVRQKKGLVIKSLERLKLANAVTEQALKATEELSAESLPESKKMSILAASVDMVAAQFQSAGMDEETVQLANASIKAVEKIADSATSVGNLVKELMKAEGGYRYGHSQLVTFLGFHVIKMMGWWGDEQRSILSQAAFYHDISLSTDEQARVHSAKELQALSGDAKLKELVNTHPQVAARELQSAPEISPEVVRVVIQHHGSPTGKGFSTDIEKLDNLTKTFILSEEWCDYLMSIELDFVKPDNSRQLEKLKEKYKDTQSRQILETFRYLDPDEFAVDFLSDKEVEFAKQLVADGPETTSVVVSPEDNGTLIPSVTGAAEPESSSKVKGVTDVRNDEEIRLKGGAATPEEKRKIKGSTEIRKDEKRVVRAPREARLADVAKTPGPAGEKARAMLQKIQEKKPNATPEEVEKLLKAGGVAVDEETKKVVLAEETAAIAEEERKFAADRPAEDPSQTVNGVTHHQNDEEIRIGEGAKKAEGSQKIDGVTQHIKDEKIVVKGDKPQDLVDRSIARIKGDEKEKEKDLKLKALAGCSDLMKAALSGSAGQVEEILKLAPNMGVELRRTDAEGRTVMHYAMMGGFVPVIRFLVEKGGQVNVADSKRRTPLFFAALYKQNEAFDLLLGLGAKVNQQAMGGMTISMIAAFSGNMHILKAAIEKGVRADAKDHSGKTALDFAKQGKHAECVTYLENAVKDLLAAQAAMRPGKKAPAAPATPAAA